MNMEKNWRNKTFDKIKGFGIKGSAAFLRGVECNVYDKGDSQLYMGEYDDVLIVCDQG